MSEITKDVTESENVRAQALNPGLRYMKSSMAVEAAASVASDRSRSVRTSAYWVLGEHGTEQAVKVLDGRMRTKDMSFMELGQLILALNHSKHPRAGQTIFANCDFHTLPKDESLLMAYSLAMEQHRISEAQETMLLIAKQPDCRFSTYCALRYFSSFPREDVVPALIAFINGHGAYAHANLYDTVIVFAKSPKITEDSRKVISDFLTTGRVKKVESVKLIR